MYFLVLHKALWLEKNDIQRIIKSDFPSAVLKGHSRSRALDHILGINEQV
jgi:hypothetical protein